MGLKVILSVLDKEIAKHRATYAAGQLRHAELAPYPTAAALLSALDLDSQLPYETRDAVIVALVAEQQRGPHPLWQSLLLQAFAPMLRNLARRDDRGIPDLEERAIMAFLEAVQRLPVDDPPAKAAAFLKNATDWAAFPRWRHVEPEPVYVPFDEDTIASGDTWSDRACDLIELRRVLEEEPNREELLEVLVATLAEDEPLFAFLARTRPELTTSAKWQTYRRLAKQRERVLKKLRVRLGAETLQRVMSDCTVWDAGTSAA